MLRRPGALCAGPSPLVLSESRSWHHWYYPDNPAPLFPRYHPGTMPSENRTASTVTGPRTCCVCGGTGRYYNPKIKRECSHCHGTKECRCPAVIKGRRGRYGG